MTPLLSAIENGYTETAKLLLSSKNIDLSSTYKHKYYEEVEKEPIIRTLRNLFSFKADTVQNRFSKLSAAMYHLCLKYMYITKTALNIAVEKNNTEIVKLLLLNPNTNVEDTYKCTYFTSNKESIEIFEPLLYCFSWTSKKTSLNIAVQNANIDIVKLLLEKSNIKSVENDFKKMQKENANEFPPLKEKEEENDSKESSEKKDEILKLIQNFINENHTS